MTVLYVRNLSLTTTEQALSDLFNQAADGQVQKVKMMRDFAFVHFMSRDVAEETMKKLNSKPFYLFIFIFFKLIIQSLFM